MASGTIPFFGAEREYKTHRKEFLKAIDASISKGQFLQGKEVGELEEKIARACDRKFGVAVNSCTDALYFALLAADIKPFDHVMVTDFSFIASASCILRTGATPIFVDIDPLTYNMDLSAAEKMVSPKVKALIYVHLYGQMGDVRQLQAFCKKHNLILIEDSAQAIGATYGESPAGSLGLASCISFDPTKVLSAPGSGGMLVTNDAAVAEMARRLRYHGRGADKTSFIHLGFNAQMPTLTAAVLLRKLMHGRAWLKKRRAIAQTFIDGLSRIPDIVLPRETVAHAHIYHKFVIRLKERDALKEFLKRDNIETMVHYAKPLHQHPCFGFEPDDSLYPVATQMSREVLSLPIHPFLSDNDVNRIIRSIHRFHVRHRRLS